MSLAPEPPFFGLLLLFLAASFSPKTQTLRWLPDLFARVLASSPQGLCEQLPFTNWSSKPDPNQSSPNLALPLHDPSLASPGPSSPTSSLPTRTPSWSPAPSSSRPLSLLRSPRCHLLGTERSTQPSVASVYLNADDSAPTTSHLNSSPLGVPSSPLPHSLLGSPESPLHPPLAPTPPCPLAGTLLRSGPRLSLCSQPLLASWHMFSRTLVQPSSEPGCAPFPAYSPLPSMPCPSLCPCCCPVLRLLQPGLQRAWI